MADLKHGDDGEDQHEDAEADEGERDPGGAGDRRFFAHGEGPRGEAEQNDTHGEQRRDERLLEADIS